VSPALFLLLALAAASGAQSSEASLREAASRHPDSFRANQELGEFYVRRHDLRAAVPYLGRAYEIDPADYANAYDLAIACLETGDLARSRSVVEELLRRQDKSELHNLLGDVEEASGNMIAAVKQYEMAARMDPSEKNVFDLATDLLRHKGFQQAIQIFEFGAGKYPQSARMRVGLGTAYYSNGRYDDAVQSLCQAVDLDPKDRKPLDFIGKMYDVSPAMADEVTRRLAGFARLYPDNTYANYYYALSLRKRSLGPDRKEGGAEPERLLAKAIKIDPKFAEAHYELGLLYQDEGKPAQAIAEYEAAVRVQPNLKQAHYRLGRLYASQGDARRAQKEFEVVRSLDASGPEREEVTGPPIRVP
jgi:tetratricopeptide (TPR) repeat protein